MRRKTNFDAFLEEQLRDPDFAKRFCRAGTAWDIILDLTAQDEKTELLPKKQRSRSVRRIEE
jgi:hypothetical protein